MTREEAIKEIKSWDFLEGKEIEAIHTLIPELAESEDERIRKELLEEIEFIIPHDDETDSEGLILSSYHARIDRYKSYLEKQKEQKPAEWSKDFDKEVENVHKRYPEVSFAKLTRIAYHFSKWANRRKDIEWSEEDKMYLSQAIETLEHENYLILADKLKSLRPSPSWKPTEDEERLINTSISFLKDFADKGYENAVECIDWLKSKLNGNTCE